MSCAITYWIGHSPDGEIQVPAIINLIDCSKLLYERQYHHQPYFEIKVAMAVVSVLNSITLVWASRRSSRFNHHLHFYSMDSLAIYFHFPKLSCCCITQLNQGKDMIQWSVVALSFIQSWASLTTNSPHGPRKSPLFSPLIAGWRSSAHLQQTLSPKRPC